MTWRPWRQAFLAAGTAVVGFDPSTRTWVTDAARSQGMDDLPPLKGRVVTDPASRGEAADDFGHLVHRTPGAVLEPGDVSDIMLMMKYCRTHGVQVAARGQGHATFGQGQVAGGLIVDMSPLNAVEVRGDTAVVEAGALWSGLAQATLARGLTPPVFTDYLELSVGGTLAVGGIGGQTHHHGAQVDGVVELEVVTGDAALRRCSARLRPDLFRAVLAGRGQCGIIAKATVRLLPAPAKVRHYLLSYPSVAALTADQRRVVDDGRFAYVEGELGLPTDSAGWTHQLEAVAFFDGPTPPDDATLLGGLSDEPGKRQINDMSYFEFLNRLATGVAYLKSTGEWYRPHPWWNMFLPASRTDAFVEAAIKDLTETEVGASGVVLLYPFPRARLQLPLLRLPDEETVFLFTLLRTASAGAESPQAMVEANRSLYLRARAVGGYQYPVGSIPTTPEEWRTHYGPAWAAFKTARERFDPDAILTPGQGIFPPDP
ncbi:MULTISPECIES: FAD-binding protein [Actinomadura]|uniref:FAD-binding protein n=1 Tax=Actinomadura yumaensis TaxID=111807 RepID=A0ABW2CGY9_9ACTN|nr:FAD-binding protein [Actinomadura sp. J1-007]MWK34567.1 FAD-binding protein [Actinomadura sp. J1-007]